MTRAKANELSIDRLQEALNRFFIVFFVLQLTIIPTAGLSYPNPSRSHRINDNLIRFPVSWIAVGGVTSTAFAGHYNTNKKRLFLYDASQYCEAGDIDQESKAEDDLSKVEEAECGYFIRDANYADLSAASRLMVESFYDTNSLFRHYHIITELNRLQSNFPYPNDRDDHRMYVACHKDDSQHVLGFVDVDCRPAKFRNAPPRPYLSDLAVHTDFRRRGIATSLVLACERMVRLRGSEMYLHLRVEFDNEAAIQMYSSLGYGVEPSEIFGVLDTTVLLKRDFDYDDEERIRYGHSSLVSASVTEQSIRR